LSTINRIGAHFADVVLREPPPGDAARWHVHEIAGRPLRFARR